MTNAAEVERDRVQRKVTGEAGAAARPERLLGAFPPHASPRGRGPDQVSVGSAPRFRHTLLTEHSHVR